MECVENLVLRITWHRILVLAIHVQGPKDLRERYRRRTKDIEQESFSSDYSLFKCNMLN